MVDRSEGDAEGGPRHWSSCFAFCKVYEVDVYMYRCSVQEELVATDSDSSRRLEEEAASWSQVCASRTSLLTGGTVVRVVVNFFYRPSILDLGHDVYCLHVSHIRTLGNSDSAIPVFRMSWRHDRWEEKQRPKVARSPKLEGFLTRWRAAPKVKPLRIAPSSVVYISPPDGVTY